MFVFHAKWLLAMLFAVIWGVWKGIYQWGDVQEWRLYMRIWVDIGRFQQFNSVLAALFVIHAKWLLAMLLALLWGVWKGTYQWVTVRWLRIYVRKWVDTGRLQRFVSISAAVFLIHTLWLQEMFLAVPFRVWKGVYQWVNVQKWRIYMDKWVDVGSFLQFVWLFAIVFVIHTMWLLAML